MKQQPSNVSYVGHRGKRVKLKFLKQPSLSFFLSVTGLELPDEYLTRKY